MLYVFLFGMHIACEMARFKQESRSISGCLPSRFTAGTSALGTLGS